MTAAAVRRVGAARSMHSSATSASSAASSSSVTCVSASYRPARILASPLTASSAYSCRSTIDDSISSCGLTAQSPPPLPAPLS
eukprot:6527574-Prymnesium_polylepis.1